MVVGAVYKMIQKIISALENKLIRSELKFYKYYFFFSFFLSFFFFLLIHFCFHQAVVFFNFNIILNSDMLTGSKVVSFSPNISQRLFPQWAKRVLNLPALAKGDVYQTTDPIHVTVR